MPIVRTSTHGSADSARAVGVRTLAGWGITTADAARAYRDRIVAAVPPGAGATFRATTGAARLAAAADAPGGIPPLLLQALLMKRFMKDPTARALWYSGFGVPLFVAGMMVSAFALRQITSPMAVLP